MTKTTVAHPPRKSAAKKTAIVPRETEGSEQLRRLAGPEFQNRQLGLFQQFLANTDEQRDELSNVMDLWDCVPRYSINRKAMNKKRVENKFLEEHTAIFQHRGNTYTRTIFPARVLDLDGVYRDHYPSANEELIEDALRKIAAEEMAGYFDQPNQTSGVRFTLHALRNELRKRGHARSYQQIVLGLNILSGTVIQITAIAEDGKGEGITKSPYFPHLAAVSRKKLQDDPNAKWAVQFHPLVTNSIDKLTYRQFNYKLMMGHSTQLARWLHKHLAVKFTFAEVSKGFETRYSTIKRDSGLLEEYSRSRDAIDALEGAFTELKTRGVLADFKREDVTGPRKRLNDVIFDLFPTEDFVRGMKASNKRKTDAEKPLFRGNQTRGLSNGNSSSRSRVGMYPR